MSHSPRDGQAETLSRTLFAAIVDSSDDVIVSKNLDGVITSWNSAAERIFGWPASQVVGQNMTLVVPDDRRAAEEEVLARVRRGEPVSHFETVRITRDGDLVDMSITVSPMHDPAGRIIGTAEVARDISERRRIEATQARLAAIVDTSDDVIVSKTLGGIITSWNRTAERVFGWTAAEAVGKHITLIVPEDRREEEEEVLARLRRGERVDHFETVRITKDGRLVDMSITVSPLKDAAGRVVGASKVARDISERRRLDDQQAVLLTREQEARRRAEALNRAKDELLATVSHELRTPLNAIFGWARLMKDGELDERARERAIDTILRNASLQARLVDDLLDLSRIVAGRMRLTLEPTNLNAAIQAALDTVRPAARAKSIDLTAALDDSIGPIQGAPDRLQQVVWNLLMNSIKFTPAGGRVAIGTHREPAAVTIVVTDTGKGIAPDVLPHVFEPFQQEDSSSTRTEGGLGLGLTLVRRLVEAHGGSVTAQSEGRNRGTTMTVALPAPRQTQTLVAGPGEGRRDIALRLQGVRVLVVDDDPDFLELSGMILRRAGAEVRAVSSAVAAHELASSWQPKVVLTDLAMPGEDGFVLARTMRRVFARQHVRVPIVAVTAYGTSEMRERATREGFDLYMTKPIDPGELTTAVAIVVRNGS